MKEGEKKKPVNKAVEKLKQRPHEAAHILDKNSRTMVKIMQLLEACEKPEVREVDKDKVVMSYVEKLKSRLSRRLTKLAKWADIPAEDRHPRVRRDPSLPRPLPYCASVVYPPMVPSTAHVPPPAQAPQVTQAPQVPKQAPQAAQVVPQAVAQAAQQLPQPQQPLPQQASPRVDATLPETEVAGAARAAPEPALSGPALIRAAAYAKMDAEWASLPPDACPLIESMHLDTTWREYNFDRNSGSRKFCIVYHQDGFIVAIVTESHGPVVRTGDGDRCRISLNSVPLKSPPIPMPKSRPHMIALVEQFYKFLVESGKLEGPIDQAKVDTLRYYGGPGGDILPP